MSAVEIVLLLCFIVLCVFTGNTSIVFAGYFLYVTVPDTGLLNDWAVFQSPSLQPTNSSHPCKVSLKLIPTSATEASIFTLTVQFHSLLHSFKAEFEP